MTGRAPSAAAATWAITRLTLRRALRDRGTILLAVIALIPVVFIGILSDRWSADNAWSRLINVTVIPLFAILPPMALAPLIAEEASGQTYSYLWSRPIPRWAVLVGKAAALGPLVIGLFALSVTLGYAIVFGLSGAELGRLDRALIAIATGTVACGALSVAVGVFLHKYAIAASAGYLLAVDLAVGALPFSVANISLTHHIRELAGTGAPEASLGSHILWLLGIAAFAAAITLWRIRRIELSVSSE